MPEQRNYSINLNMITHWQYELAQNRSKVYLGQSVAHDEGLTALKHENMRMKKERDLLREAAMFFAKDSK